MEISRSYHRLGRNNSVSNAVNMEEFPAEARVNRYNAEASLNDNYADRQFNHLKDAQSHLDQLSQVSQHPDTALARAAFGDVRNSMVGPNKTRPTTDYLRDKNGSMVVKLLDRNGNETEDKNLGREVDMVDPNKSTLGLVQKVYNHLSNVHAQATPGSPEHMHAANAINSLVDYSESMTPSWRTENLDKAKKGVANRYSVMATPDYRLSIPTMAEKKDPNCPNAANHAADEVCPSCQAARTYKVGPAGGANTYWADPDKHFQKRHPKKVKYKNDLDARKAGGQSEEEEEF